MNKIKNMLSDAIELAKCTGDDITVGEFFDQLEMKNNADYIEMLEKLDEEGMFE